jgi:cytosine/adenosine deaminase-related metal-dependent hydrolase/SAM-dependent methyltransferase
MSAASNLATVPASAREGYRLASRVYDREPNPMLALEERYLGALLPSVSRSDVVDLGCGTGRWLACLAPRQPRSLTGVDLSSEMLLEARRKLGDACSLVVADCTRLPLPRSCADLIVCSFVASYVNDLAQFAAQIRRLLRPNGAVFVADVHPETSTKLHWRRGFRVGGAFVDIATHSRSIPQTIAAFDGVGLKVDALLEPFFGAPELSLFQSAGKSDAFHAASESPAIYVVQLSARNRRQSTRHTVLGTHALKCITGARVTLGPHEAVHASIVLEGERIASLRSDAVPRRVCPVSNAKRGIDLTGVLLLPGLINAHDHLEFALFPRLGKGGYRNFLQWADDLHHPGSSQVLEHRSVPKSTRLWWGAIRNLLCGVTTVCHHNPYASGVFDNGFVLRVLRDFAWAHSVPLDHELVQKHRRAGAGQPFIVHLAEGTDLQSAQEIFRLDRAGALDERTVLVHGLGLNERGIALVRSRKAALVWCPTSNVFLFGRTHDRWSIQRFPHVALGSDSPLTAQGDLLDELRFAYQSIGVSGEDLYAMVTTRAAQVLRLKRGEGTVRIGALADFVGIIDKGDSPARTLASLSYRDVELVIIGGRVQLASPAVLCRLPRLVTRGLRPLEVEGLVRWIRAPLHRLVEKTRRHLPGEIRLGGRIVRHGLAS